ncbi:MAG TPA: hypothetical protein VN602_00880 [Gemmatimonadaceae bacterium]|nr:hypothetical protein [Gemmatimonadaceae bacterium]
MPAENNEKLTGPHSGWWGVGTALVLTAATWAFLFFLHLTVWHDPINPISPNERSTVIQPAEAPAAAAPASTTH